VLGIFCNAACALYLDDSRSIDAASLSTVSLMLLELSSRDLPLSSCLVASVDHTRKQIDYPSIQGAEFLKPDRSAHDPNFAPCWPPHVIYENEVLGALSYSPIMYIV